MSSGKSSVQDEVRITLSITLTYDLSLGHLLLSQLRVVVVKYRLDLLLSRDALDRVL